MMYVGFPALLEKERLRGLEPLPVSWPVSPEVALRSLPLDGVPGRIRVGTVLGRPVYHAQAREGGLWHTVYADTGRPLGTVTLEESVRVARGFWERSEGKSRKEWGGGPWLAELVEYDQWTVSTPLNAWRPLYRVTVGDSEGTELYVSARTGEVVRDTRRWERGWNYLGAVVHWLYLPVLRWHNEVWRWVGRMVSGLAILLPATGWALLLWERRRTGASRGHRGTARVWHRRLGWVFGLPMLAWIASGFLSFRIVPLFDDGEVRAEQRERYEGGNLEPSRLVAPPMGRLHAGPLPVEGEYLRVAGRPSVCLRWPDGTVRLEDLNLEGPGKGLASHRMTEAMVRERSPHLLPGEPILGIEMLEAYDAYFYTRRPGEDSKPLPVFRVRFGDTEATWFHLDPRTGRVLDRWTRRARLYRWSFHALHSWDWPGFAQRRPLWDGVVLAMLAGGFGVTCLGLKLLFQGKKRVPVKGVAVTSVAVEKRSTEAVVLQRQS